MWSPVSKLPTSGRVRKRECSICSHTYSMLDVGPTSLHCEYASHGTGTLVVPGALHVVIISREAGAPQGCYRMNCQHFYYQEPWLHVWSQAQPPRIGVLQSAHPLSFAFLSSTIPGMAALQLEHWQLERLRKTPAVNPVWSALDRRITLASVITFLSGATAEKSPCCGLWHLGKSIRHHAVPSLRAPVWVCHCTNAHQPPWSCCTICRLHPGERRPRSPACPLAPTHPSSTRANADMRVPRVSLAAWRKPSRHQTTTQTVRSACGKVNQYPRRFAVITMITEAEWQDPQLTPIPNLEVAIPSRLT